MSSLEKLFKLKAKIKKLEKEQSSLREEVMQELGRKKSFESEGYVAIINTIERESLDKKGLMELLGNKINKYKNITSYKQLKITKA